MKSVFRIMGWLGITLLVPSVSVFAAVYHIELVDLDAGQPLTPPVAVVHGDGYVLFEVGAAASAGLEALAEDGMTDALVAEAEANGDVSQVVVGGSAPTFARYSFFIEGNPGDLFSVASMFARTNDIYVGVSGMTLPDGANAVSMDLQTYDSGTEVNTGMVEDIPAYGNVGVGTTENGVVSTISAFTIVNDPTNGVEEFSWPPAAQLTITPMPDATPYRITIEGTSEGQPLTPPVVVSHSDTTEVFELGGTASPGLELIAEEGMFDDLVAELEVANGVFEVFPASDAPGFVHEATITAQPGQLLSIVTMLARTNDVITGVRNAVLPPFADGPLVIEAVAYDAGTETNTGLVEHIPFYGNAGGPDEGGVITMITEYTISNDPDAGTLSYSWPPVATITIEPMVSSSVRNWSMYE